MGEEERQSESKVGLNPIKNFSKKRKCVLKILGFFFFVREESFVVF